MSYGKDTSVMSDEDKAVTYRRGYDAGYTWLINNFLHPSQPKGYVPGGPFSYDNRTRLMRKVWVHAWITGINEYVKHNHLSFPHIDERDYH